MAGGAGRTDRTPYFIFALSILVAAVGGYYGTRETDGGRIAGISERVKVLEETIPLRRQMRDAEMLEIRARLTALESRRAGR